MNCKHNHAEYKWKLYTKICCQKTITQHVLCLFFIYNETYISQVSNYDVKIIKIQVLFTFVLANKIQNDKNEK